MGPPAREGVSETCEPPCHVIGPLGGVILGEMPAVPVTLDIWEVVLVMPRPVAVPVWVDVTAEGEPYLS